MSCKGNCNCKKEKAVEEAPQGFRHSKGKVQIALVPPEAIVAIAAVLSQAADSGKYPLRNWELGMPWSEPYNSLQRHLLKWFAGEDTDTESGLPHLYHICCNAAFLATYEARGIGADDRPKVATKLFKEAAAVRPVSAG